MKEDITYQQLIAERSVPTSVPTVGTASRRKTEDHIQHAVAMVLDELGLLWFHTPNELGGMVSVGHLGQLIAMGLKKGVSDCLILDAPPKAPAVRFVALELKAPGGTATPDQRVFLAGVEKRGGIGKVAHGLHAALGFLEGIGWDVAAAEARLQARGYVVKGDRMVRVANRGSRARKCPARG